MRNHALRPCARVFAAVTLLVLSSASQGQALYWDTNGTTDAFGNFGGSWNGTAANWNTDAAGGAGGTLTASTTDQDDLFVAGAGSTGIVTVSNPQSARSLAFNNTANLAALQISNGASLTLTGAITDTGGGNADIRVINTNAANAATVLTASSIQIGVLGMVEGSGGAAQFWTTGYDMTMTTQFSIGRRENHSTFRQTGGTITVNDGSRGVIMAPDVSVSGGTNTTTYVMDGGTLKAQRIGVVSMDGNNNTTNRHTRRSS